MEILGKFDLINSNSTQPGKAHIIAALHSLADKIQTGELSANAAVIMLAENTEDQFTITPVNVGCDNVEATTLASIASTIFKQRMGYTFGPENILAD